ncbi:MAG: gamma carbonic anhydrase family protein [Alphaproteobacteria bacterium]|nr:gamma carbonic anhydrase family protein [Alphaproteobacteria bacterium]
MLILPYRGVMPMIDPSAFIAPGVVVIGDVEIGAETSVWPGCVLRGDVHVIRIGARTNIQDGTVVHVTAGGQGTHIGDDVTVGHMALLHDCTVESNAFVGMKAILMDGARIESRGVLAAAALLTPKKVVPSGQLWAGSPARFMRDLTPADMAEFGPRAQEYVELMKSYR